MNVTPTAAATVERGYFGKVVTKPGSKSYQDSHTAHLQSIPLYASLCPAVLPHVQIDRFLVSDPRPADEVEAQRSVQKLIRKAFQEAKVAKQKAREKARAARAQAVKEQQAAVIFCSQ